MTSTLSSPQTRSGKLPILPRHRLVRQPHGFEGFRASGRVPAARPRGPGRWVLCYWIGLRDRGVVFGGFVFAAPEDRRSDTFFPCFSFGGDAVCFAAADPRAACAGGGFGA